MTSLLLEPAAKVGTVGLVGLPVDEFTTGNEWPCNVVGETLGLDDDFLDRARATLVERKDSTVSRGVSTLGDVKTVEDVVQVALSASDELVEPRANGDGSGGGRRGQKGSRNGSSSAHVGGSRVAKE